LILYVSDHSFWFTWLWKNKLTLCL